MADIVKTQGESVPSNMKSRWVDMGDGTHALQRSVVVDGGGLDADLQVGGADISNANPMPVSDAGQSLTVDQPTHDNLNLNANLQVGDVDADAANPIPGRGFMGRFDATLSLDTNIYATGDLLADTQAVAGVCVNSRGAVLYDMRVIDLDDQGTALDVLFLRSNTTLGAENAAYAPTDAMGLEIIKKVVIQASDFTDEGLYRAAYKSLIDGIGCVLEAVPAGTSIWIAAVCRSGTPTYSAGGIHVQFGAIQNG